MGAASGWRWRKAALLVGVSQIAFATAATAQPQADAQVAQPQSFSTADEQLPEQVLVTGSLIHGATAVGVPVTSLGTEDFSQVGALTASDLLKTVPSLSVLESLTATNGGNDASGLQRVAIHNIGGGSVAGRTLLMVNGIRIPNQGNNNRATDPSFIPALALDRLDVLADGASATYGSDAIAGVLNLILKRGYDGAVTQFRISDSTDVGGLSVMGSQLFGKKWDTGDVTVTYQYYNQAPVPGPARGYFTYDLTPWGLNNVTPLNSAEPAIVSVGKAAAPAGTPLGFSATNGRTCSNCYSIPKGQNGVGLTWAAILASPGVGNEVNPYSEQWVLPQVVRNSAVVTFDQNIWRGSGLVTGVQFFADGFYDNRRLEAHSSASGGFAQGNAFTVTVPSVNPYYPIGAPAGLSLNYDINQELLGKGLASSITGRYDAGFNLDLPFGWTGKILYSKTEDKNNQDYDNLVNPNLVSAAVGNTIAASGSYASFTKPSNIPYLNLFCDPTDKAFTCNDPATLAYIMASRQVREHESFNEATATFDGPLFVLPGGPVRAAVGTDYLTEHWGVSNVDGSVSQIGNTAPSITVESDDLAVLAFFGQLNIPIIGRDNAIPLVQSLEVEISGRFDHYSTVGSTKNPKFAVTWNLGEGLAVRGTLGTSFRAPIFEETNIVGATVQPLNVAAGNPTNNFPTCPVVGQPARPGSAAAIIDPNCSAALQFLGGLNAHGGAGLTALMSPPGFHISPESSHNWAAGFDFAPTDFLYGTLNGLDLAATLYHVKVDGLIGAYSAGSGLNDPLGRAAFILPTDPNFSSYVKALTSTPFAQTNIIPSNVAFIENLGNENVGWSLWEGIDFNGSYDWNTGPWGAWNIGITGNYQLQRKTLNIVGGTVLDAFAHGLDSGGRLNYRARLGWTDAAPSAWSVTLFMNYRAHWGANEVDQSALALPPACFLAGNTPCNASGLPEFAQYTQQFPILSMFQPAFITFDLSIGYSFGDRPASDYLKNITLQLNVNDLTDRAPNFMYNGSARQPNAFNGSTGDPMQRVVSFVVTKRW